MLFFYTLFRELPGRAERGRWSALEAAGREFYIRDGKTTVQNKKMPAWAE